MFVQTNLGFIRADQVTRIRDVKAASGHWTVEVTLDDGITAQVWNCDGGADELARKLTPATQATEGWTVAQLFYQEPKAGDAPGQVRAELSLQPIIAWRCGAREPLPVALEGGSFVYPYAVVTPAGDVIEDGARLSLGDWINRAVLDESGERLRWLKEALL